MELFALLRGSAQLFSIDNILVLFDKYHDPAISANIAKADSSGDVELERFKSKRILTLQAFF